MRLVLSWGLWRKCYEHSKANFLSSTLTAFLSTVAPKSNTWIIWERFVSPWEERNCMWWISRSVPSCLHKLFSWDLWFQRKGCLHTPKRSRPLLNGRNRETFMRCAASMDLPETERFGISIGVRFGCGSVRWQVRVGSQDIVLMAWRSMALGAESMKKNTGEEGGWPARWWPIQVETWDLGFWMRAHGTMAGICSLMALISELRFDLGCDSTKEKIKWENYL